MYLVMIYLAMNFWLFFPFCIECVCKVKYGIDGKLGGRNYLEGGIGDEGK